MHHAPCIMHHAPCTMHHAPCTMHHAHCTMRPCITRAHASHAPLAHAPTHPCCALTYLSCKYTPLHPPPPPPLLLSLCQLCDCPSLYIHTHSNMYIFICTLLSASRFPLASHTRLTSDLRSSSPSHPWAQTMPGVPEPMAKSAAVPHLPPQSLEARQANTLPTA